jgi:type I restriction-modification system DNA methylase subunit
MPSTNKGKYISLNDVCHMLSISVATGKNWVRLGKLLPEYSSDGSYFFSESYAKAFKKSLISGEKDALKSRRNKKYVSGNSLYMAYLPAGSKNLKPVSELVLRAEKYKNEMTDSLIRYILRDCALKLLSHADAAATGIISCIDDLIKLDPAAGDLAALRPSLTGVFLQSDTIVKPLSDDSRKDYEELFPDLFSLEYVSEPQSDILGLIYISLRNIGNRKASGMYYTPAAIARKLINNAFSGGSSGTVLDPCCGSGNFLLQLPDNIQPEDIFGYDIDPLSVLLARINLALRYPHTPADVFRKNIVQKNFLISTSGRSFDNIIGNPPWGYEFSKEETAFLKSRYVCAQVKSIESYDVFTEAALNALIQGGTLSFVIPEAILTVRNHLPVRKLLFENTSISFLAYLGDVFDKVQCPSVILCLNKTCRRMNCTGMRVEDRARSYTLSHDRLITPDYFSFLTDDDQQSILDKIENCPDSVTLKDQAVFALGIVTGNNNRFITHKKTESNEPILKGTDISRYHIADSDNYIEFTPGLFQQVAPAESYRAPEKILYKFISSAPAFAYDNRQRLSLNSCNIVIPKIPGLHIKYILAVLNSGITEFYLQKKYHSVKMLRSHIESIPIPVPDDKTQAQIISSVDAVMNSDSSSDTSSWHLIHIDQVLCSLYGIAPEEYNIMMSA